MEVKLLVTNEKANTREVRLGPETVIGRNRECNLRIVSGQVSRRHCLIRVEDDRVVVRDLGSANGTEVDGATVPPEIDVPVAPGSTLVVGPLKFVFEFISPPPAEPNIDDLQSTTQDIPPLPAAAGDNDVDDTKDYGPAAHRSRPAPAPRTEPGSSELDFSEGLPDAPVAIVGGAPPAPAEGSSLVTAEDTLYDNELADRAREAAERTRAAGNRLETGTDLLEEEPVGNGIADAPDESTPLELTNGVPPAKETPVIAPDPTLDSSAPHQRKSWKFLNFLNRGSRTDAAESSKPAANPASPSTADEDPALQEFFKRSEP